MLKVKPFGAFSNFQSLHQIILRWNDPFQNNSKKRLETYESPVGQAIKHSSASLKFLNME